MDFGKFIKSNKLIVGLALILVLGLVGYFTVSSRTEPSTTTTKTQFLMDTSVDIRAIGPRSEEATDKAFAEMKRVEQVFSRYIATSDVTRINQDAGQWVTVSQETIDLIEKGIKYGELTDGAFDITIGRLVTLWGFGTDNFKVPSKTELEEAMNTVDYRQVEVNRQNKQVRIPEGSIIDLGGLAKGYAVDRGANLLRSQGIPNAIVNAGGDISTIGTRPDGNQWRVGIQDPRDTAELLGIVPLEDSTIVTSGDYQRYFMQDNMRFHHIIDPRTGYPAQGLTSVSVIARTAAQGDALSTALFVLGSESSKQLVEKLADVEAVIVDENGEIWVSSGLSDSITILR